MARQTSNRNRLGLRRTPKVFQSNYKPPRQINWSQYRSLTPLLWILGAVVAIYLITKIPLFRITNVEIVGSTNPTVVAALNNLKGTTLLSREFTHRVEKIRADNPIVSFLTCTRGLPHTARCQVALRSPALIWKNASGEYLVDANGYLYGTHAGEAGLIVEDKNNQSVKMGQVVVSGELASDYNLLAQQLTANQITFGEFFVTDTLYQVTAVLTGSQNPAIPFAAVSPINALFVMNVPIGVQVKTLTGILQNFHSNIKDHIDVRVPGYAYYQ